LQHQYLITENESFYKEKNKHAFMIDILTIFMHFHYLHALSLPYSVV